MARRLNATDAYLIMTNLVKQATGEATEITTGDLSAYISAGEKVMATGFENTLEALSIVLGRTIIAVRPYKARASLIRQDDLDLYKTRMRKISYYSDTPLPAGSWNTDIYPKNLARGRGAGQGEKVDDEYVATKSQWEQHPVIPVEMNFSGFSTWDDAITIYKKQLKIAMRDPQEMANYLNGQMISKGNDIELEKEAFDTMNLIGYMGSLFAAEKVLHNGLAVNMTAEFNNHYGTSYTSEQLRTTHLKEFNAYLTSFVKTMIEDFRRLTAKRHWVIPKTFDDGTVHGVLRATPYDRIKIAMYDPFWKLCEATVYPEIFNEKYLTFDNFESFTFWQTDIPGSQAKISLYPALPDITGTHSGQQYKGDKVELDYVLGVIFDEDACVTNHALDDADATPLEARKKFYSIWWNFVKNATVDISEQGVLLYMADNSSGGKSTVVDPSILDGKVTFQ